MRKGENGVLDKFLCDFVETVEIFAWECILALPNPSVCSEIGTACDVVLYDI